MSMAKSLNFSNPKKMSMQISTNTKNECAYPKISHEKWGITNNGKKIECANPKKSHVKCYY